MTPDSRPPLKARLLRYELTSSEFRLLQAILDLSDEGKCIWPSVSTMMAYSQLSKSTIMRAIHGDRREGRKSRPGFLERGILTELAPSSFVKKRSAIYRFNEAALQEYPPLANYLAARRQRILPGIRRPSVPGELIETPEADAPIGLPGRHTQSPRDTRSVSLGDALGLHGTPDSKAFDPKAIDPREREIQEQPALSLDDRKGNPESDLEWAKRFTRH